MKLILNYPLGKSLFNGIEQDNYEIARQILDRSGKDIGIANSLIQQVKPSKGFEVKAVYDCEK